MVKIFIKRIFLSIVISVLLTLSGVLSLDGMQLNIEAVSKKNIITIDVSSKNPTTVNGMQKYTKTLEKKIKTIKGLKSLSSFTDSSKIEIETEFNSDQVLSDKLKEVGNIVVTAKRPEYVKIPIVKQSAKGSLPLMVINTYSKTLSLNEITRYAKEVISGKLDKIQGVSYIEIKGEPKPEIQIRLDQHKISYYNINIDRIRRAFEILNKEKGFLSRETNINEFSVLGNTSIKNLQDIKDVIVDTQKMIKMSDISEITFSQKEFLNEQWINGDTRVVTIKIFKTNEGNPLETSDDVMKIVNEWKQKHELVVDIEDNASDIREFFHKTKKTFIEAVIIVLIIVFIFLGSLKASITPILSIPISLLATLFPMSLTGCSINVSTLMGFLLAIGLVVDDAILVVENITKHYSRHKDLERAAIEGTKEIQTSIIVMTMTLACVFFPAIISKGAFGATLREFAITLSVSVIISGIISLTLTPAISARVFGHSDFTDKIMIPIENIYKKLLLYALKIKNFFILIAAMTVLSSGFMVYRLPRESMPSVEKREITIYSINSGNKHLKFFKKQSTNIVKYLKENKDIENFTIYMSNNITLEIRLHPKSKVPIEKIKNDILEYLDNNIKDVYFTTKSKRSDTNFDIYIYGNLGQEEIKRLGEEFTQKIRWSDLVHNAIQYSQSKQGYNLKINYQKAAALNCDIETIEKVVEILNTRYFISALETDGKKYNIVTLTNKSEDLQVLLQNIWNERRNDKIVKISPAVFANVVQTEQINSVSNYNALPAFKLEISGKPGVRIGDLINNLKQIHKETVSSKTELAFTGKAQEFLEDQNEMQKMFILSSVFIFLILLAQFESIRSTLIVMMTAPLAIWGSLLVISQGGSLNIYSTIAMITLIGLITKHGILFVNTANEYFKGGMNKFDSSYLAATSRLRPVLMTTLAMALGIAPLLFERDASMIKLFEMAKVLVPGILIGTVMTLFIIPCLFLI